MTSKGHTRSDSSPSSGAVKACLPCSWPSPFQGLERLPISRLFSPISLFLRSSSSDLKRQFALIGCSQGLSSMFMAFAISGSRTPPYLQAILTNFALPTQFVVRSEATVRPHRVQSRPVFHVHGLRHFRV